MIEDRLLWKTAICSSGTIHPMETTENTSRMIRQLDAPTIGTTHFDTDKQAEPCVSTEWQVRAILNPMVFGRHPLIANVCPA